MRRSALVAAVPLLFATATSAQTLDDLKNDGKNSDNTLTYGMGYQRHRYSPLNQINKSNLKRLVLVWNLSLDNNWGEQAQPLIYNGVMYVTNARATVAIDVATGKQIWKHNPRAWPSSQREIPSDGIRISSKTLSSRTRLSSQSSRRTVRWRSAWG
jgi:alcohol dehydrogenase (cytochrome c)